MVRYLGVAAMAAIFLSAAGIAQANETIMVCAGRAGPPCPAGAVRFSASAFASRFPSPTDASLGKLCAVTVNGETRQRFFSVMPVLIDTRHGRQVWQVSCFGLPPHNNLPASSLSPG